MLHRFSALFVATLLFSIFGSAFVEGKDMKMPVRGLCLAALRRDKIDDFIKFIEETLVPGKISSGVSGRFRLRIQASSGTPIGKSVQK